MKRILLGLVIGGLFTLAGISFGEMLLLASIGLILGLVTWLDHATRRYETDSIARDGRREQLADTILLPEDETHAPLEPIFEDEPDTSPPLADIWLNEIERLEMEELE